MYIVETYSLAIVFSFITMLCWGSWGNTQKLASKNWRYELYYWDYVIGIVLFSLVIAFTTGSFGSEGRPFLSDLRQVDVRLVGSVLLGGVVFNASNILLSASVSLAGLAVAFPLGVGLALVFGVLNNYLLAPKGDPLILFFGVILIVLAIVFNGVASSKRDQVVSSGSNKKGIFLAIIAGVLMSFFYRFVAVAMDLENFRNPTAGMMTPYTATVIFSLGVFFSNFLFNSLIMRRPFVGAPVSYREYFRGKITSHVVGVLGGAIWCLGTAFSYIASGEAGPAISYGLGQGAPLIAAIWGVFVWKEFKGAGKLTVWLLSMMFIFFLAGLALITISGGN